MKTAIAATLLLASANVFASGSVGIYAIVEKVVFEPNDQAPERIQVWGAFVYFDDREQAYTAVKRGYMYFRLPAGTGETATTNIRREWADLKSVAGTGQAVAFGLWGYIGGLEGLQSDERQSTTRMPPYILAPESGNPLADVRVRPAAEPLNPPAAYATNAGIVKLSAEGNNAEIVKQLRESLKR